MPRRPPREWMKRCTEDVAAGGAAVDPSAVCGATWQRKTPAEKRTTIRVEETMHKKKAKKKHPGGHKKAHHKKPHHAKAHHPKRGKKKTKHHRCAFCGHSAVHGKAGCMHVSGSKICDCKHRG